MSWNWWRIVLPACVLSLGMAALDGQEPAFTAEIS
jgi:hypothetical protein